MRNPHEENEGRNFCSDCHREVPRKIAGIGLQKSFYESGLCFDCFESEHGFCDICGALGDEVTLVDGTCESCAEKQEAE
jgi:hypothetical protein